MSAAITPTFFLAPNWQFPPSGRIAIGNIVVDPLQPHRPLPMEGLHETPETDSSKQVNWCLSVETANRVTLSVWSKFLEKIQLNTSVSRKRLRTGSFTMRELETIYLKRDPTPSELQALCNEPSIRYLMRTDSPLRKPVYMVSGIKIARGFALESQDGARNGGSVRLGGEVAPEALVGGSVEASRERNVTTGFEAVGDIVFAYELLKIKPKGWGKKMRFETKEYHCRQAFLTDEDEEEQILDEAVEGELAVIDQEDIDDLENATVIDLLGVRVIYS